MYSCTCSLAEHSLPRIHKVPSLSHTDNGDCLGWRPAPKAPYKWMSYGDVEKKAVEFGAGLSKLGVDPGQDTYLGIYSHNTPDVCGTSVCVNCVVGLYSVCCVACIVCWSQLPVNTVGGAVLCLMCQRVLMFDTSLVKLFISC